VVTEFITCCKLVPSK